jgi:hypothetical protein
MRKYPIWRPCMLLVVRRCNYYHYYYYCCRCMHVSEWVRPLLFYGTICPDGQRKKQEEKRGELMPLPGCLAGCWEEMRTRIHAQSATFLRLDNVRRCIVASLRIINKAETKKSFGKVLCSNCVFNVPSQSSAVLLSLKFNSIRMDCRTFAFSPQ